MIDDLPVLEEAEWDFDEKAVPDKEVRACLIWECARESWYLESARWAAELQTKAEPSYWDSITGKRKENSLAERRKAKRELRELAFDFEARGQRALQPEGLTQFGQCHVWLALEVLTNGDAVLGHDELRASGEVMPGLGAAGLASLLEQLF